TQQYTATGTYSDGSIQNLTTTATWSSSNLTVATIGATGLATARGLGTATITAVSGNIDGTAALTVTPATLSSIAVTPNPASVTQGQTIQFTATGTYSDGSTAVLTNATWNSLTTSVATISTTGLATGVATGTSGISASDGNIVGSTTLTVTAAPPILVSITVIPANPSVAVGGIVQFIAIGNYSNGTTQNLTATALWTTSSAPTATVSNVTTAAGQATGVASGTATIAAASGAISGSTTLTVTATPANLYVGSVSTANCCLDAVNTSTNAVVKSIPITTFNEPLGITPDQTRVYVADYTNNLIDVVDSTTNTLVTTIPVGPGATAVAITPNGQFGYVAEYGDNNVSVFNVATNAFTQSIPVGFSTDWIAVTPDGSLVYAASAIDGRVAVISTSTNTLASTITLTALTGQGATGCVSGPTFNPTGTVGYFLQGCQTTGAGSMTAISIPGNTEIASVAVGTTPYESAITPNGTKLYVVNASSNTVSIISTASNTVTSTITVGTAPQSVIVSPDGTAAYVASTKSELINLIQTSTDTLETTTIPITAPFGFAIANPPAPSAATVLTLTPPNLIFGSHISGTVSTAQSITVTNPGTKPVTLTSIALTGPSTANFTLTNGCGTTLGSGASCTLLSTFAPATTGSLTALITITNTNGLASYTQSAPLSGVGTGSTVSTFSGLTASQTITAGAASITLAGVIKNGNTFPTAGEVVLITIDGITHGAAIGTGGGFTLTFATNTILASTTPYTITYNFAGDATFTSATDNSTTLTVNPVVIPTYTLAVTDIGTGNGTVADNTGVINCVNTAGVQSGTCTGDYASGTAVTLTATPFSPSTFAAWGGACSGTTTCVVTMTAAQSVTASFAPPPQQISLTFNPGIASTGMATYDCPGNPSPSPTNPCTAPNAHAVALTIGEVITPFTLTVQATELPPSMDNGICPTGGTPATNFACRFVTYFTYQTTTNGEVVPLCVPYANGNCVHYQVFSGTPGTEPNPADYVGPVDWQVTWNNGTFVPPAPYTGSTPQLYDDPDYAVSVTSPYGSDCTTPMLVGNPPTATNPPIYCQFEFDITTAYLPGKGVDPGITGRTKQLNDVVVAFPPANVGNLTVTERPVATSVTPGNPIGFTITITDSAAGPVTGATLTDILPAGTNVNWTISPAYTGPGTCAITGAVGSQVLSCAFGTISASQSFTIGVESAHSSIGTYTDTATIVIGTQQILSIGTLSVQGTATFSGLTSQTITAGTASISLSGVIGSGTSYPAAGETVTITINGVSQTATIGSNGAFTATFATATIPASTTPYTITYSYAGDLSFTAVPDTSTTLTVDPSTSSTLVISPSSVDFGQVPIGRFSFKPITLSNIGTAPIRISKVAMSRTGTGDYDDYSVINHCPKSLAAGSSCTLTALYAPEREDNTPSSSSTSILITDSVAGSPQSVPVKAQNINPKPKLSSNLLFFGYQTVGTISGPQTITLTNAGTTPLNLNAISITGDFSLASTTTCKVGTSLTPKQSCSLVAEFQPTKTGIRGGLLTVTDNAVLSEPFVLLGGIGK
ncbi:MAG: choice-of-anchor D domain-containing protein, partial [Candidatus Acidiferrum sp.]